MADETKGKKPGTLSVLMGYAGSFKWLTILGCALSALAMMFGIGFLYFLMMQFMETLVEGADLPGFVPYVVGIVVFLALSFALHLMQYKYTYTVVCNEVAVVRLSLAERLRKLPLGFFGKRDLADLTETLMSDMKRLEHVWSHVLGYLYGSYISTAIIAVMLFIADWRLAIACLWGVPVAFALLFGSRKPTGRKAVETKAAALAVSDGVQETLDNIREIRATNQEQRFLDRLGEQIDESERAQRADELLDDVRPPIGLLGKGRFPACSRARRCSSSRIVCARSRRRTKSSCSPTGRWPSRAALPSCYRAKAACSAAWPSSSPPAPNGVCKCIRARWQGKATNEIVCLPSLSARAGTTIGSRPAGKAL